MAADREAGADGHRGEQRCLGAHGEPGAEPEVAALDGGLFMMFDELDLGVLSVGDHGRGKGVTQVRVLPYIADRCVVRDRVVDVS